MWICFTKLKARIHSKLLFFSYASWTEGKCLLTNTQGSGSFTHLRIWTVFPRYMPLILDCDAIGVRKHFSAKKTISPFPKSWDTNSMEKGNILESQAMPPTLSSNAGPGTSFLTVTPFISSPKWGTVISLAGDQKGPLWSTHVTG